MKNSYGLSQYSNKLYILSAISLFALSFMLGMIFSGDDFFIHFDNMQEIFLFNNFFSGIKASYGSLDTMYFETPFSLVLYYVVGLFIPKQVISLPVNEFKFIQQGNFVCISFISICFLIWVGVCLDSDRFYKSILLFFSLFTIPSMYVFQSGGMELIPLTLCTIFLMYYDSESDSKKNFAYICLGIAGAIRIYLLLFGLLLNRKKDNWSIVFISTFLTLISILQIDSIVYFKSYLSLLAENNRSLIKMGVFLLSIIVLIIFNNSVSMWQKYYLIFFLLGILCGNIFSNIYVYFMLLFLLENRLFPSKKKEIVLFTTCELLAIFIFNPFFYELRQRVYLCWIGIILVLLFTLIKEKSEHEILSKQ